MTTTHAHVEPRRALGIFIMVLATFTVFSSLYFESQARAARNCTATKIREIVVAVTARNELAARSNVATQTVILAAAAAQSEPDPDAATPMFRNAFLDYSRTVADIERDREKTPLPEFPPGECSS